MIAHCVLPGTSAKPLAERPEGAALLDALADGDTVIAPKLARMFRSASDALAVGDKMKKRSISLRFIDLGGDVTGNGISKLVFTILSAVAEAERDRIRERFRDVKTDQRERRRFLWGVGPSATRWTLRARWRSTSTSRKLSPGSRSCAALARRCAGSLKSSPLRLGCRFRTCLCSA